MTLRGAVCRRRRRLRLIAQSSSVVVSLPDHFGERHLFRDSSRAIVYTVELFSNFNLGRATTNVSLDKKEFTPSARSFLFIIY